MPMNTDQAAARGIELLNELLAMKSSEDGVPRSAIGVVGPADGYDQFKKSVQEVAALIFTAQQAIPIMERLTVVGRALDAQGTIKVDYGESFALKALEHFLAGTAST